MSKKSYLPRDRNGKTFDVGSELRCLKTGRTFRVNGYTVDPDNRMSCEAIEKLVGKPSFNSDDVEVINPKNKNKD